MNKIIAIIWFALLVPVLGYAQVVVTGTGQIIRSNQANVLLTGNWLNNASGGGYTGVNTTGKIAFVGSNAQSIGGTAITNFTNFEIDNTAGVGISGIDVNITHTTFVDGIISIPPPNKINIPDGGTMWTGSTTSFVNGTVSKTGNDPFVFEIGDGTKYAPIEISAPSAVSDVFEANYIMGVAPDQANIPSNIELVSGFEFWGLQQTNGSSSVNVTLYWFNSQQSEIGVDLTHLFIVHHDGTNTWDLASNGGTFGAGDLNSAQFGSITGGPYSSFSMFTFGSDNSTLTPLPVEIIDFNVNAAISNVELKWSTASETNNDFFTIQKSQNGGDWIDVAEIGGAGNSTMELRYSATDNAPFNGISYYRLMQTDFDGTHSYSDIKVVKYNGIDYAQISIFPNPTENRITIQGGELEINYVQIFNSVGQKVTRDTHVLKSSSRETVIDLSSLPSGIYSIKTRSNTVNVYKK